MASPLFLHAGKKFDIHRDLQDTYKSHSYEMINVANGLTHYEDMPGGEGPRPYEVPILPLRPMLSRGVRSYLIPRLSQLNDAERNVPFY